MEDRYTHKNPRGGYRVWMAKAGTFRLESQGGEIFAFGDLINKLGRLEDEEQERRKGKLI